MHVNLCLSNLQSKSFYTKYGSEILKSSIILEDDLDFLCIQSPQQFLNAIQHHTNQNLHRLKFSKLARSGQLLEVSNDCVLILTCLCRYQTVFCALLACVLSFWISPYMPSLGQLLVLLCSCFVLFFNIRLEVCFISMYNCLVKTQHLEWKKFFFKIVVEMWKRQHKMNLVALKRFLSSSNHLHKLIRKSIRLIQEIEVVSRGYKL